jgi:S1-C subfamily serine protease
LAQQKQRGNLMENIWSKLSNDLAEVSATAGKSVVAVHGTRHPSSGIVIAKDAILAASHAVRRDDEVTIITAPGQKLSARVAGRDPSTDVVVLRLQRPCGSQFGDSLRSDQRAHAHMARR